jgi:murein DD-endopeptidase MepM/ murein hydrolase activator NlpD
VIGLSGSTGRSTAPHLHFEIRRDGRVIDPRSIVAQEF